MSNVYAVILAGGSSSRLWPLCHQHLPKQCLAPDGDTSLLQTTIERPFPVIDAATVLIASEDAHAKGEAHHSLYEPVGNQGKVAHFTGIDGPHEVRAETASLTWEQGEEVCRAGIAGFIMKMGGATL